MNFTIALAHLPPAKSLTEFRALQRALLGARREEDRRYARQAAHLSGLAPSKAVAKRGKAAHKAEVRQAERHQAQAGPRSPFVPKPVKKSFKFVPYQAGQQIQMRSSMPLRPVS